MNRPLKMKNPIQPYAWGSMTAIADLLGQQSPSNQPEAELWMGAHPKAPSQVWYQGRWQSLQELIRQDPLPILGQTAIRHFGSQFPFLLKILAVDQPLSIQAHPDKRMAQRGFARENEQGIALTAAHRNYRDAQHKPECVCALTPFTALCGFRDIATIRGLLAPIWPAGRIVELDLLSDDDQGEALKGFFNHLMKLPKENRQDLIDYLVEAVLHTKTVQPAHEWIVRLNNAYPGDIGALSPCFLHLVTLTPGQALFLPSGKLHAYLKGVSIEVMANSDNVLRGGLTPKHVDIDELLSVLDFRPAPLEILTPEPIRSDMKRYPSEADEFELATIDIDASTGHDSGQRPIAPEILLCTVGKVEMCWGNSENVMQLSKGESVIVPAQVDQYALTGHGTIYKAGLNHRLFGLES